MQLRRSQERDQYPTIVSLQIAHRKRTSHRHLGALLREMRQDAGVSQEAIAEAFEHYSSTKELAAFGLYWPTHRGAIQSLSDKQYGKIERNQKPPWFNQLIPLYLAMTAGCGIAITPEERSEFVALARQKIEAKEAQYHEHLTEPDWLWVEEQLCKADGDLNTSTRREYIQMLETEENLARREQEQRAKLLADLVVDTSHIIGREDYCTSLLSFLKQPSAPRKKVVAISAMSGVGKTSVLKLLQKGLLAQDEHATKTIICDFQDSNKETSRKPQDWFDQTLAAISTALEPRHKEVASLPPAEKRVQRVLQTLCAYPKPIVIFLDDAQRLIETDGAWCEEWKHFLQEFMSTDNHQATLYMASREWPIWQERETSSFLFYEELPTISTHVGIQLWHNLGFAQEDAEILRKATEKCGNNPRMMELVAQKLSLPDFSFAWDDEERTTQEGLAHFVEHPHLAGIAPLLEEIIGNTLSEPAKRLLKLLALAPVSLPPPVVLHVVPGAKYYLHELVRASLLAKRPDRLRLLPMVSEAVIEYTPPAEHHPLREQFIQAYHYWLQAGKFSDEQEQASVVAELLVMYLRHWRLMEAAELLISGGWLCYHFGHGPRLARVCQETLTIADWKQSPSQELAAHLLSDRLATFRAEKITTENRAKRYQALYQKALGAGITLAPSTIVHLLQPVVTHLTDIHQFGEVEALINTHLSHLEGQKERDPFTYASYLYYKAYLLAKWGEYEIPQNNTDILAPDQIPEQARIHLEEALKLFQECIELLRESERGASPLEQSRAIYKRARRQHNYAYYARVRGTDLDRAKHALEDCIKLEKRGYTTPGSLATAYAEYAQLLASMGNYQEALGASNQAAAEIEKDGASGYAKAEREKAVLLVERGEIHLLIGNLAEARLLFSQAKPHLEQEIRREKYYRKAEIGLQTIVQIESVLQRTKGEVLSGQLDWQWFPSFSQIADYDISSWLDQAGPFTVEEQQQWDELTEQGEVDERKHLMHKTLQCELDIALQEQRAPSICYPAIPISTVRQKIEDCLRLKNSIEREEPNTIVKRFYREALDQELNLLRMVEATSQREAKAFASHNQLVFALPTAREMEIAVGELLKLVERGMRREGTKDLSCQIKSMLQASSLITPFHHTIREMREEEEACFASPLFQQIQQEQRTIPVNNVAQFLEGCIREYGFSEWGVCVESNALSAFVENNTKQLVLPKRDIVPARVLHLLAHEGEKHIYRHANGARSKLSLLGHGLAGYSPIEEALAVHYSAQVEHKKASLPWIGTLATGLVSGISSVPGQKIQPFGYHELYQFMRTYHLLSQLLAGKDGQKAQENAHRFAQRRCLRTWQGAPAPLLPGICWLQDTSYLHGTLQLADILKKDEAHERIEQLSVGCIGVEHLSGCFQLGIIQPVIPHKQLAMQEDYLQAILDLPKNH